MGCGSRVTVLVLCACIGLTGHASGASRDRKEFERESWPSLGEKVFDLHRSLYWSKGGARPLLPQDNLVCPYCAVGDNISTEQKWAAEVELRFWFCARVLA